ncbi:nucleoside deaminase [Phormidium pseudopriestleyi FRX01]|uniref:Nucleoside deaminase n=1 Tax=Phormidium pseudopriestleyi FRX01 TaxID=1759528 RepID=A0ABS3FMV0_9CYAN|nr:nucleoside deaminase [Phormidium pseudopriestleyi]MBO0348435.1 nucleoside deaminase [Phormidium pseudopriestleyi FRX01]
MESQIKSDEDFIRLAIAKAMEGVNQGESPFGACIVKGGEVVSCVHNICNSSVDATAHAEVHAIRDASKKLNTLDLSGCVIYSTCEPCPMCFTAAYWAKLDKIVFGARIADACAIGFTQLNLSCQELKPFGSQVKLVGDVLKEESLNLFQHWVLLNS